MIKKYFDKFKYQRKKRELLFQLLEESEEHAAEILSPSGEFVPYYEAIPEIKTFLAEIEAKEKLALASRGLEEEEGAQTAIEKAKGNKQDQESKDQVEEVDFDPAKFNPFDRESMKQEEAQEVIKPKQPRKVLTIRK